MPRPLEHAAFNACPPPPATKIGKENHLDRATNKCIIWTIGDPVVKRRHGTGDLGLNFVYLDGFRKAKPLIQKSFEES